MEVFFAYCIPCVLIGFCMSTMITCGIRKKVIKWVAFILISAAITAFAAAGFTWEYNTNHKQWNSGVCIKCGGNYKFTSAAKYRNSTDYFYSCENCGHVIVLDYLFN